MVTIIPQLGTKYGWFLLPDSVEKLDLFGWVCTDQPTQKWLQVVWYTWWVPAFTGLIRASRTRLLFLPRRGTPQVHSNVQHESAEEEDGGQTARASPPELCRAGARTGRHHCFGGGVNIRGNLEGGPTTSLALQGVGLRRLPGLWRGLVVGRHAIVSSCPRWRCQSGARRTLKC
jgi:hypothetical protein